MEQSSNLSATSEPNPVDKDGLCLLSLDGGGVRGLSTLHILKTIMDEINEPRKKEGLQDRLPCQVFDMIGGTSTGGLIAIMLGRLGMTVDKCIETYRELMGSIFGEKAHWIHVPFNAKANIRPQYDTQKVRSAIEYLLDGLQGMDKDTPFDDGNKDRCKVFVCSVSQETDLGVRIRSYGQRYKENIHATICEAALATSAATTYFAPVTINSCGYIDGALGHNNPVEEVRSEAHDMWCPDASSVDFNSLVKCWLTVGTGVQENLTFDNNAYKLMKRLPSFITETETTHRRFQDNWRREWREGRVFRFQVSQGLQNVGLDSYKKEGHIVAATAQYLEETIQQTNLRTCVENLRGKEHRSTPLDFHTTVSNYKRQVLQGSYDFQEVEACRAVLRVTDVRQDREALKTAKGPRAQGTFEWILEDKRYKDWKDSGEDNLWITAGPARGKTMLSLFILEDIEKHCSLANTTSKSSSSGKVHQDNDLYYFFCTRNEDTRRSAISALRSLIFQIVQKYPRLIKHVLDSLQPMAQASEHQISTNQQTDGSNQAEEENKKQLKNDGKSERRGSSDNQNPAPSKLPMQMGTVKIPFSRMTGDAPREGNVNARQDAQSGKGLVDSLQNTKLFQKFAGKARKEEHSDDPEKQEEEQSESRPNTQGNVPERNAPKSRQLDLLDVNGLSYILKSLIREMDAPMAYFLLDGVDECHKPDQKDLMPILLSLQDVKPGKVKLVVVSQLIGGMGITPTIKLEQNKSDIRKVVSERVKEFAGVEGFDELRSDVEQSLLDGAEGTFLWVSLVVQNIKNRTTCMEILAEIKSTPPGLNEYYSYMLQQIEKEHQDNVYRILCWVTAAVRPLSVRELSAVINIPAELKLTADRVVRDQVMLCGGLLDISAEDEVKFVHATAGKFLLSEEVGNDEALKRFHVTWEELHYSLAQFAYDYIKESDLTLSAVKVSELSDKEEPKLLKYAIKHWMDHVRESKTWAEKNFNPNEEFFKKESKLRKHWFTAFLEDGQEDNAENFKVDSFMHMAAYFGIVSWIKPMFDGKYWVQKQGTILMELDHYQRTPLHIAVEQGHSPVVSLLLEQGVDIEFREASLFATPLLLAARNGHKDICEILLNKKARINARNRFYATPLTEAARAGHTKVVELLVRHGADVNGSIDKGQRSLYRQAQNVPGFALRKFGKISGPAYIERSTPMIEAARRNHADIIRFLRKHKADIEAKNDIGYTAMHTAAYYGHIKTMDTLLELGANIERRVDYGFTALYAAAFRDQADAVKWLLEHHANIEAATPSGITPLMIAARNNAVKTMRVLIDAHATIEHPDEYGNTTLTIAAYWHKMDAVKLLLENHAKIEARTTSGNTALIRAIQGDMTNDAVETIQALLSNGANIHDQNHEGETPLIRAAKVSLGNSADVMRQLLARGAALETRDNRGRTALMHEFNGGGLEETREILLDKGAALEAQDELGDTPLIIAAGYSSPAAVQLLIDRGANIEARNRFGFTPLMKAARCGYMDTVELLLERGAQLAAKDHEGKGVMDHAALRERGDMISLLKAKGADRKKLTLVNRGAALLSDVMMHWTEEAVQEWERKWESAELKKLEDGAGVEKGPETQEFSGEKDDDDADTESETTKVDSIVDNSVPVDAGDSEGSDTLSIKATNEEKNEAEP